MKNAHPGFGARLDVRASELGRLFGPLLFRYFPVWFVAFISDKHHWKRIHVFRSLNFLPKRVCVLKSTRFVDAEENHERLSFPDPLMSVIDKVTLSRSGHTFSSIQGVWPRLVMHDWIFFLASRVQDIKRSFFSIDHGGKMVPVV
jgi:hypothetical protein